MAKSGEFYTFDEVVRQLKIDENKLKRLVSEGEISAFREGDVMKFKKTEIDKIASKSPGSETSETVLSEITLEDEAPAFEESGETLTDDLVFEGADKKDEIDLEVDDAGMKTAEISSQDTFIEEKGSDDVGMTTEPIDLSADLAEDVEEEEIEEVEAVGARQPRGTGARRAAATAAPSGNAGVTFALVVACILGFMCMYSAINAANNEVGTEPLGDMAKKVSGWFYEGLGSNKLVDADIKNLTREVEAAHGKRPSSSE